MTENVIIDETVSVSAPAEAFINHIDELLTDKDIQVSVMGTKLSALFNDENFIVQCQEFANLVSEAEEQLLEVLNYVEWDTETVSLGDLLDGSQLQSQHGLSSTALSNIFLDKVTGLVATQFAFLYPVEAFRRVDGTLTLSGGHHRLTSFALILKNGGLEWGQILDQQIPCFVASVNIELAAEAYGVTLQECRDTIVPKVEAILWLASNGSRKPDPSEKSSFNQAKLGVDMNDPQSIINSGALSSKDKCVNLLYCVANSLGYVPNPRTKFVERTLTMNTDYPDTDPRRFWAEPKSNTLQSIMKSTLTALSRIKLTEDGKTAKWLPTISRPDKFYKLAQAVYESDEDTGLNLLEQAIIQGLQKSTQEHSGNIGYNASSIGAALATLIDENFEPLIPATPKGKKAAKATDSKTTVKFKHRSVRR